MPRSANRIAGATPEHPQPTGTSNAVAPQECVACPETNDRGEGRAAEPGSRSGQATASGAVASGPGWRLERGDCLALMAGMPDDSMDVVITDPPYDEHTHKSGRRGSASLHAGYREAQTSTRAAISRTRSLGFDAMTTDQMDSAAAQFARLARRWSLVFCTVEMVGDSAADGGHGWRAAGERAGLEYVRTAVWHKLNAAPQFTGDRPSQAVEAIVCFHRPGRKRWNGGGKHGYYAHPIVLNRGGNSERLHTTQKPLSLMRELVEDFTDVGEVVLDAYAGSGTTLLAAKQLGRRSVGFELAACAKCSEPAEWFCSWWENKAIQSAYLCDGHRAEAAIEKRQFGAHRDNYFAIAARRLRGDEAKPRPKQPGLFDSIGGTP